MYLSLVRDRKPLLRYEVLRILLWLCILITDCVYIGFQSEDFIQLYSKWWVTAEYLVLYFKTIRTIKRTFKSWNYLVNNKEEVKRDWKVHFKPLTDISYISVYIITLNAV